jgi:N4-(beta-N-acetylglucosaminyl)-L-asparaginase
MRYTDHVLLVGEGARRFAREMGFEETDLLTDASRRRWLEWRASGSEEDDYLTPEQSGEPIRSFRDPGGRGALEPTGEGRTGLLDPAEGPRNSWDGVRPWGTIHLSVVSGEAVIKTVGAHTIVEEMRRGVHPQDACLTALRRIVDWTVERRLLREDGRPNFNVNYYAVNVKGEHGAAALWSGSTHAVHDGTEGRIQDSAYLFESEP